MRRGGAGISFKVCGLDGQRVERFHVTWEGEWREASGAKI